MRHVLVLLLVASACGSCSTDDNKPEEGEGSRPQTLEVEHHYAQGDSCQAAGLPSYAIGVDAHRDEAVAVIGDSTVVDIFRSGSTVHLRTNAFPVLEASTAHLGVSDWVRLEVGAQDLVHSTLMFSSIGRSAPELFNDRMMPAPEEFMRELGAEVASAELDLPTGVEMVVEEERADGVAASIAINYTGQPISPSRSTFRLSDADLPPVPDVAEQSVVDAADLLAAPIFLDGELSQDCVAEVSSRMIDLLAAQRDCVKDLIGDRSLGEWIDDEEPPVGHGLAVRCPLV